MQNKPLVSVICLCYNHQEFVVECLNSIIKQDYSPIEIIIADDYSKDRSKEIIIEWLKSHPSIIFLNNSENIGVTKTFNKALNKASGEYILDLAADDLLLSNCISTQIETFMNSRFSNLGIVYGNAELIDEKGKFLNYFFPVDFNKKVLKKIQSGDMYKSILSGETMCSVSALIKREVYNSLNGYDESLAYEDLDFWIRASRIYNFQFIDQALVKKRTVKNSHGSKFYETNNVINFSTYLILKKTIKLNRTKEEHKALLKRVHFEIVKSIKINDFILSLKLFGLKLIIFWKIKFY